jgi:hypothetical protein
VTDRKRRAALASFGVALTAGAVAVVTFLERLFGPENDDTPVVGNGGDPATTVKIRVELVGAAGTPVVDEPVVLEVQGDTLVERRGQTDDDGELVFVEDVGPPPCNFVTIRLAGWGRDRTVG